MSNHQENDCLFCRIVRGEIPATIVYRNEHVVAFKDISPTAPHHVLIIPVQHVASLNALSPEHEAVAGQLLLSAAPVDEAIGIKESGYRFVINTFNHERAWRLCLLNRASMHFFSFLACLYKV